MPPSWGGPERGGAHPGTPPSIKGLVGDARAEHSASFTLCSNRCPAAAIATVKPLRNSFKNCNRPGAAKGRRPGTAFPSGERTRHRGEGRGAAGRLSSTAPRVLGRDPRRAPQAARRTCSRAPAARPVPPPGTPPPTPAAVCLTRRRQCSVCSPPPWRLPSALAARAPKSPGGAGPGATPLPAQFPTCEVRPSQDGGGRDSGSEGNLAEGRATPSADARPVISHLQIQGISEVRERREASSETLTSIQMGFYHVAQAGFELLSSRDLPALGSPQELKPLSVLFVDGPSATETVSGAR
ncbi:translation initiation factor IF-2-like [Trachypithecus francoisi]|uniref:translation initiation factor IF-2-like n=1 Tax=Trachypithecus francoisi TaxID=54180 RepID=UPI00141BD929|nr:translation initiation factor IF-2-like [Trachypithecus francoisi]